MRRQILKTFSNVSPLLTVAPSPAWRTQRTAREVVYAMMFSLIPAFFMAIFHFGLGAIRVTALSAGVAVVIWLVCEKMTGRKHPVGPVYALFTGILFSFLLPASAPWWLVSVGAACCIIFGSVVYGGVGCNPLCAPLVGWAICSISWPKNMDIDLSMLGTTLDSPLSLVKYTGVEAFTQFSFVQLFMGEQLGGLGAVQIVAIVAAGLFLLARGYVRPFAPLAFLAGVTGTALVYWLVDSTIHANPLYHLLTGHVFFAAFFLVTDWGSSPVGRFPLIFFGLIAGILVIIIRTYGVYPDGVAFAVLLANLLTPLLEIFRPRPLIIGGGKGI